MKKILPYIFPFGLMAAIIITGCKKEPVTPPNNTAIQCTQNTSPVAGSNISTTSVTLSWATVTGADSYDVFLGTTSNPTTIIANNISQTSYTYTLPNNNTATYYWYVVPKNKKGAAAGCSSNQTTFTFSGIPANATNVSPANDGIVTTTAISLNWNAVAGATLYDVYFGTSAANAILVGNNIATNTYTHNLSSTALSNTYYWYVVPKNSIGSAINSIATATHFKYLMIKAPAPLNFPVIGYFPSYRSVTEYPDVTFKMCNVVCYAFANINTSSTIDIASPSVFSALYTKAKANGSKVFLSVNASSENFKTMGQSASNRLVFINDIMAKLRQYALDGVDLDYEYPKTTDGTDTMFALLTKQLSDSLHVDSKYYLSAAITPGLYAGNIRDGIKTETFNYIDLFNIMVYDDFTTEAAYPYKQHSPYSMAVTCLNYWINTRGMPQQKAVLGIPAYGRNSGAKQIAASYKTILSTGTQLGPTPINLSDSATLTNATTGATYTTYYNGINTVKRKTDYAKLNAGGIMFWEIAQDTPGDANSLIRAANEALGRSF